VLNPDERPGDDVLATLKRSLPEEWREEPLGWPAVQGWEAENGVVLPEPYRTLVAEISNGSALGPPDDGGLLPLGWLPHDWYWSNGDERDPSTPFPLEQPWFWETDPAPSGQDRDALVKASARDGSVLLGSNGSEDQWILVTAGPLRGRVWLVCEFGACPFARPGQEEHERQGVGFLDWLTYWSSLDGRSILEDFAWPHPASST
jgi:hypothetical protein